MMFTAFPCAFCAISLAKRAALASILPEAGTAATITSMPFSANASFIPLQYCIPGRNWPASRSSSKPRRPCASTTVCFYVIIRDRRPLRQVRDIQVYLISVSTLTKGIADDLPYSSLTTAYSSLRVRPMSCNRGSSLAACALLNARRALGMKMARCDVRSEQSLACKIVRIIGCRALFDDVHGR